MKKRLLSYKWSELCVSLYFIIIFCVFPLYYQNNYIDILEAKTSFFVTVSIVFMIVELIAIWCESIFKAELLRKIPGKKTKESREKKAVRIIQNRFFLLFVCSVIISTIVSGDIGNAWNGPNTKMFGTKILLLCCGIYYILSKKSVVNKKFSWGIVIGTGIVFGLSVLNRYGIDPLKMYTNLVENQKGIYISTIGNTNIVSNYICIFIPVLTGTFLYSKECLTKVVSGILVYMGMMAGVCTNSDSFFLGLGACLLMYLWFFMEDGEKLKRYLFLCIICACSVMSLNLMNQISDYSYEWEIVQEYLITEMPWTGILLVLIILEVIICKKGSFLNYVKVRRVVFVLLGMIATAGIIWLLIINTSQKINANSMFVFSDTWGTNRGYVWKRTCLLFKECPLYQKIIGIGPGGFKEFFSVYNVVRKRPFVDPHSEILYYLVSMGIVGSIGYFGMIISAIGFCLKTKKENMIVLASIFISWLAQGTVNNPLVFTTPYIFMFLGICAYESKKIKSKD